MALTLGIDTGGTYTDAALLDLAEAGNSGTVLAKAKALTTRHDLSIGILEAARRAIDLSDKATGDIALVSLSTTLATNALVEGQGGRVALVAIGFSQRDLQKAGLAEALGADPLILLPGGHTTHGAEAAALDTTLLEEQLDALGGSVSGFAVAAYFAVRNPAHEHAVRDLILNRLGAAVTCSHELSAKLNGPRRALTTVLNARLVPMITRLIRATQTSLEAMAIRAPLTVVRGDGALVGADFASRRPIETILSGPAASLVGARFLTGTDNAYVCDIGGTTSDVAVLENGQPKLDEAGALVGGFRTMVEAVAMHTYGLGGDSEVSIGGSPLNPQIALGPRRLVPVSLVARDHGAIVHEALDRQLKSTLNNRHDGRFAMRTGSGLASGLSASESALYERVTDAPQALDTLLEGTSQAAAMNRLVAKGLVFLCGLTPSDAMHVTGEQDGWDRLAAEKAARLFARQRDGAGKPVDTDFDHLARRIIRAVKRRSAEVVLQTALTIEGRDGAALVDHELIRSALDGREFGEDGPKQVAVDVRLATPLVGLGASAHQYHHEAARLLATEAVIPEHADVANAIGAVVGQISVRSEATVSQPGEGRFAVTGIEQPFADEAKALAAAEALVRSKVAALAREAGAADVTIDVSEDIKRADFEGRDMLIEARLVATASGRPPIV